jgi:hypothetical protein
MNTRPPTTAELRSYGKRIHKKGIPIDLVAVLTPDYIPAQLTKETGWRDDWYFWARYKDRNAVVRDVHLSPPEILLDFIDNDELLWIHPETEHYIDGPYPGPWWGSTAVGRVQ